jgi:stage II sporulation protein D
MVKRKYHLKIEDFVLLLIPLVFLLLLLKPAKEEAKTPPVKVTRDESYTGSGVSIRVYQPRNSVIVEYDMEEYLVGVVAAEMPPEFELEALKAQAVAARTYAYGRMKGLYGNPSKHYGASVCTDSTHCQAWITRERFLEVYGDEEEWEKIRKAVYATRNKIITYEGTVINPLFHSNSGGVTEDVEAVWAVSGAVPYLTSVYSPDESGYSDYEKKVLLSWDEIKQKVKNKYPDASFGSDASLDMEVLSYTTSGRVMSIRIGSVTLAGTELRELLGLRSTNFELTFPSTESVEIVTEGYGHGVGMSQCGADALAKEGYTYTEILEYYYTGINVGEIGE